MRRKILSIWSVLLILIISLAVLVPGCEGEGEPTGTVEVNATLDDDAWGGSLEYELSGPGGPITGSSVDNSHTAEAGDWTCAYVSGGPPDVDLVDIAPSPTQSLTADGSISFTFVFETPEEQVDASITFVSWTIDGAQVPPGSYTVYPPTIIDCEYDVVINGTYCQTVNATVSLYMRYHYGGPNEFKSWHVANAPGSISTIPPGTIWSQNCTVNGVPRPPCYSFDVLNCHNVTLGVTFTYEAHKGTTYRHKVNWLGYRGSGPDNILFDNLIEWAGCWGDSDMVTWACVSVPGDVNPENDCSDDSPMLYIKHDYLC